MALASLVSSQKQKRTIVKIFLKSDTKKRFSEEIIELSCVARKHSLIPVLKNRKKDKENFLCLFTFSIEKRTQTIVW